MEDVIEMTEDESVKSEDEDSEESIKEEEEEGNPHLADALLKAIRMSKKKSGKSIVLSKAKLYNPNEKVISKTHDFEIEPDPNIKIKEEKEDEDIKPKEEDMKPSKKELRKLLIKKQQRMQIGRLKPSALDREKERPLARIATRGVVQLFNAVRQQQSIINSAVNKPGVTEVKKDKLLKTVDKKAFIDVLMGKKNKGNLEEMQENIPKMEVESEPENDEPSWKVLRDDFMVGAKLKDWDKKEIEIED